MLELKLCNNKIKESKTRKFKKGKWNVIIKAMKRKWMCGVYNCGDSFRFFMSILNLSRSLSNPFLIKCMGCNTPIIIGKTQILENNGNYIKPFFFLLELWLLVMFQKRYVVVNDKNCLK